MNTASIAVLAGLIASIPAAADAQADDAFAVRRFMISMGVNDGGSDRVRLRYAAHDAGSVASVFQTLGGVRDEDRIVLVDPDHDAFVSALSELEARIHALSPRPGRVEVFVYYSGHSDERGLLIGESRYEYQELRAAIDRLPADVRVVILDSCASGVLTRLKGGTPKPPFLVDTSRRMEGHAFLTSSSEDEAAQESDRIGGSFFTNALVSGLRGAADASGDGRVTLNEAYQFAFDETLARTEATQGGAQHPAYDIQLVGAGDLVMTDIRGTTAGLQLGTDLAGRIHVRDRNDALVVALQKMPGRTVELGLEPGDYRVVVSREGDYYGGRLHVDAHEATTLTMMQLSELDVEAAVARGGPLPDVSGAPHPEVTFSVGLWPGVSTAGPDAKRTVNRIALNLVGEHGGVRGFELGWLGSYDHGDVEGVQYAGLGNVARGGLIGAQLAGIGNVSLGESGGHLDGGRYADRTLGVQFAGVFNLARDRQIRGMQGAGVANVAIGPFDGVQAAGVANEATHARGAQLAGVANHAVTFEGVQASGAVNVVGDLRGAQFSVVNVGRRVEGAMVGVVNVAEDVDGAAIGLLSVVKNGHHRVGLWASDVSEAGVAVKLGSRHVYTLYTAATESVYDDDRFFIGLGLGAHIPARRYFVDVEVLANAIVENSDWPDEVHMLNQARVGLGVPILDRLSVVVGGTVNVYVSKLSDGRDLYDGPTWHSSREEDTWVRVWPGFYLGLEL